MAAMHRSLVQEQIANVTECSICTEIFTNPKILPCVHTFCLHCLENYGKNKKPGDQMVCPICRKEFLIPDGGLSNLPSNFFIGKMMEIGKLTTTPATKSLCALCPEEDEVLAQLFCFDCEQNLCSRCGNGHKKSRFSQHHQVVELGSQPKAQELNLRNSYCDHHPRELIKMFCYEDNVAICLVCCVESHQSHRCVNVDKAAGEFVQQLKDSLSKVTHRLPECQEFGEKLDKYKKEFEGEVFKTEASIRDAADKMTKLINQHTELLVQDLKVVRERNLKAFEITKQENERFRVMIDGYSRYSEELLTRGSPVDICRAANQMLIRAQALEILPSNCDEDCLYCDSVAFHSANMESLLSQQGLNNAVGELAVTRSSDWLNKFKKSTTAQEHKNSEEATTCTYFSDIPEKTVGEMPQVMIENKRFGVVVDDEGIWESFSLSDPAVVEKRVHRAFVKKQKHVTFDVYKPPTISARTIQVSNIPSDVTMETLEMMFENRCNYGGETDTIVYYQTQGTAVITFKDQKVAETQINRGSIRHKNQTLMISRPSRPSQREPVRYMKETWPRR